MAEDRREQELRAAAKQLAGVQRQHRPDQTAAARSQAGQKAQPQRTAQQATAQTANSNGSGKALSGQQIQQMRTTNTPAKESMSQTKQIQHQLEQEVADIMDAESFADLVFIDPDPLPETSKKEEGRTVSLQRETKRQMQPQKHRHHRKKIRRQSVSAGHTGYKETAVDKTTEQAQESDKQEEQIEKLQKWGRIGQWFSDFLLDAYSDFWIWYMVVLAVRKRTPGRKENLRPSLCIVPSACDAVGAYHFVCVLSNGTEFRRTDPCLH